LSNHLININQTQVKKTTCKNLRGACDSVIQGETAEEMGEKCRLHFMEMVQKGDAAHKTAVDDMRRLSKDEQEKWFENFKNNFASLQDAQ